MSSLHTWKTGWKRKFKTRSNFIRAKKKIVKGNVNKIISQKDLDLSSSWGHAPSWPTLESPSLPQYTSWSKCNINCIFQKQIQCLLTLSWSNVMLYRVPNKVLQEKKIFSFTFLPFHSKMTWIQRRSGCKITHLEFRRLNTVTKVLKYKDKVSMLGKLYFVTFEGKVSKCVLILLKSSLFCLVLWFQMNSKIWLNIILYSNGNRILVCLFASPHPWLSLYQYLKWIS